MQKLVDPEFFSELAIYANSGKLCGFSMYSRPFYIILSLICIFNISILNIFNIS